MQTMTPGEMSQPRRPSSSRCMRCGGRMQLETVVGETPSAPEVRLFRCDDCETLVTVEITAAETRQL